MSRYVELNAPAILAQTPFDRATGLGIRCRIFYQDGIEEPESPVILIYRGSGHYSTTWIPRKAGEYSLSYEFFTDTTFTTESLDYEAGEDILNARSTTIDESCSEVGGAVGDAGGGGSVIVGITSATDCIGGITVIECATECVTPIPISSTPSATIRTIGGRSTVNVPWRRR